MESPAEAQILAFLLRLELVGDVLDRIVNLSCLKVVPFPSKYSNRFNLPLPTHYLTARLINTEQVRLVHGG